MYKNMQLVPNMAERIKSIYMVPTSHHFRCQDRQRLKVKGQKKMFHTNRKNNQKLEVVTLLSDKTDFKTQTVNKDKKNIT